ncbi:MAG: hypothetical protein F4010_04475 [Cenarchaeum sp. SB0669_bin_11]|nr:hypothetical protein [Cenarchaeum sp. SB0669_bin_11]
MDIPAGKSFRRKRECDTFEADRSNAEAVVDAYLAKAAPDIFTFVLYKLESTNNHSERAMRFVVGHRNVRIPVCSLRGM